LPFAGLGSVTLGFAATGRFEPLLLTDVDPVARDTDRENIPKGARYLCEDVRELTPRRIVEAVGGGPIAALLGCPPCQGFSSAGKRDVDDPNNRLLRDFFVTARRLDVQFFVMENVPAVLNQAIFEAQISTTRKRYRIWRGVLNAALYGLPRTRQRCIVIGYHRDLGISPTPSPPTHFAERAVFHCRTGCHRIPSPEDAEDILGKYPRLAHPRGRGNWCVPDHAITLEDLVTVGDALTVVQQRSSQWGPQPPETRSKIGLRRAPRARRQQCPTFRR
jgi:DNA (cytosine-5)-methyltransferase 1